MFEKLLSYRQIGDLSNDMKVALSLKNDRDRRSLIPLAVVDDESFKPEQNLRANGYDVRIIGDIKDISELKNFNIILCDLQGVGRHLSHHQQGAFIIDEIKRNHPEKFVVAYTGGALDDAVTIRAQQDADFFLRKDADIDEWRDKLDLIIGLLCDPVEVWRRQREALVDADVPTLNILKLEDAYVRSLQAGSDYAYRNIVSQSGLGADVRSIAQSLIASGIFKVLVG